MKNFTRAFTIGGVQYEFEMIFVEGTRGTPYLFGEEGQKHAIEIKDFYISKFPITQAVWKYVMGDNSNRSQFKGDRNPVEHVSWNDITGPLGFLERINRSTLKSHASLRLPSETEWEYAARGGKNWRDGFTHSGSNDVDSVAWYEKNSGRHTWPVGQKAPNQLGIYDMSGNVWEWCEDIHVRDTHLIPTDGKPYLGPGADRVLRGGCHHNWAIHCTVSKRYEIMPDASDECIGFRLALEGR